MPGNVMDCNEVLEKYVDAVCTADTHKRLKIGEELTKILNSFDGNVTGSAANQLVDGLQSWISSSNFKVSSQGLELVGIMATKMESNFKYHLSGVLPLVVDRLGDSKPLVREQALNTLFKFMSPVSTPQFIFDNLVNSFNHKNWRVREVLMICLIKTINTFGASSIQISKITPHLIKLLSDPTGQVRDTTTSTMVEVYRHVGERFRTDLLKRKIPETKLNSILLKFDETQKSGNVLVNNSETDGGVTPERKKTSKSARRSTSFSAGDKKKNNMVVDRQLSSGALDEIDFMSAWEEVADAKIFSSRDIPHELDRLNEILSNANNEWEKRVEALKQLRSVIKVSTLADNFPKLVKDMENAFRISVKDLRSSVVKEACITLSYLSSVMGNRFDYLAEVMLPPLIALIPNSAKIMSTSGHATIKLIIKHTASPRLIPIIVSSLLTSKAKDIRRKCAEYMGLLLEVWDTSVLKSHVGLLEEAIRKGIADADSEARAAVRRAYWNFADHYRSRAENLMEQFDSSKQKLLQSDKNLITAGVTKPSEKYGQLSSKPIRSMSTSDANGKKKAVRNGVMGPPAAPPMQRSASQLDYKRVAPHMTPRQKSYDELKRNAVRPGAVRDGRSRYAHRSTTSQPSSRSGSPKRMPVMTRERSEDFMKVYSPQKTRIPTPNKSSSRPASRSSSRQTSRDPSPVRSQISTPYDARLRNGSHSGDRQSVTEDALWDALKRSGNRNRNNSQSSVNGQGSDESDTSSLFSYESSTKRNVSHNYNEILSFLQQDSSNAKRDGLISLQAHLHGMKSLSSYEAVRVKETFNRYFAEPNSKIYSIFLDVLSEFIVQYKNELQDWLFVLLTRLLQRISTDILPSAQTKIARVLDVVRDSYPYDHQFQIITKYVTDNTQTPSLKMKVALLQYLTGLIALMDASDFANTAPIRLAVSRIVTWISEPKSADVRKEASTVIFALFQLNTAEFTNMLSSVPNSIQEGATRVIKTHMKQDTARLMQSTPVQNGNRSESTSHYSVPPKQQQRNAVEKTGYRTVSPAKMNSKYQRNEEYLVEPVTPSNARIRHDSYDASDSFESHSRIPVPHKLSYGSNEPNTPLNGKTPTTPFSYATHVATDDSPMWLSSKDTSSYNPKHYEDSLTDSIPSPGINRVGDGAEHPEAVSSSVDLFNQISTVLSGAASSEASEDIKSALLELLKMMRAGTEQMGGYKLKSLTAVLLKLLKHKEATIRCLTARVLREVASAKADIYRNELRSFILPLLETESDSQKEVSKTAEECCAIVTQKLSSDELFPVIAPLAGTAPYPANVSAIKMLSMVVDNADHNCLKRYLDVVVQSLLKAYDHDESSVRKAAVFCLVSVHNMAGAEHVAPYFKELSGSKVKLLNLYIRRSQSANV